MTIGPIIVPVIHVYIVLVVTDPLLVCRGGGGQPSSGPTPVIPHGTLVSKYTILADKTLVATDKIYGVYKVD